MNPRPTQEWYNNLYENEFWEMQSKRHGANILKHHKYWKMASLRALRLIHFVKQANIPPLNSDSILEIGSAYGFLINRFCNEFNSNPCGIEPSSIASEFSKKQLGVKVMGKQLSDLYNMKENKKFNVIILSHVLENIVDLGSVFKCLNEFLTDDGVLLIETPNIYLKYVTHVYHPYCFCKTS